MSEFLNAVRLAADGSLDGVSDAVILAMGVVGALLPVASIWPSATPGTIGSKAAAA